MTYPKIRVSLAISPTPITLGDENCTLTITATLDFPQPITIYTWPSIFALDLAQRRGNFTCIDLSDNFVEIDMCIEHVKRAATFSLQQGRYDDQFLVTFYPGIEVMFKEKFGLATRVAPAPFDTLTKGHRYRFGVSGEWGGPRAWFWGTREEIMTVERKNARGYEDSDVGIECEDVEFEVVGDATGA